MKTGALLPLIVLALSSLFQRGLYAQSKEYTPLHPTAADTISKANTITQVLPDRSVVFRLKAPDAHQVSVLVGFSNPPTAMAPSYPLKKDSDGLWSATVGPLATDLYEVQFNVDGLMIADPRSPMPKPQRQVNTSLLQIPGDPPIFLAMFRTGQFAQRPGSLAPFPEQIHRQAVPLGALRRHGTAFECVLRLKGRAEPSGRDELPLG